MFTARSSRYCSAVYVFQLKSRLINIVSVEKHFLRIFMKNFSINSGLYTAVVLVFSWSVSPVQAAPDTGPVEFISESRTYTGQYAAENRSIAVEIDGVRYQGHYASNTEDEAALQINKPKTGQWGRGFLFAHRAKVLQCQLNSGFPKVSGQCQSADGRQYEIAAPAKP